MPRLLGIPVLFCASVLAQSQWPGEKLACAGCHEQIVNSFRTTPHGKAMEFGGGAHELNCETCHKGDLPKHMETSDPRHVTTPEEQPAATASDACISCHTVQKPLMFWRGSSHQTSGLTCMSCHTIHRMAANGKLLVKRTEAETCFGCHVNVRKAMLQRSTHLFRDERGANRLECYSCHNPHGTQTESLISANSVNEKCYECHQDKRGPFLWEHAPVRENCMSCHSAHGSNNPQLLAMRTPQLCQSCHLQGRHQTVAGRPNAIWNINRRCVNCHAQVHGSNHPSGPILMR